MQDTHFDPKMENSIQVEWGYKCYFASYKLQFNLKRCVFNNNFEFSVQKVYEDSAGNYVFTVVKIMDKDFLIVYMDLTAITPSFILSLKSG